MTHQPTTPRNYPTGESPPQRWAGLRQAASDILDELVEVWDRIEALTLVADPEQTGRHLDHLRTGVERLATHIQTQFDHHPLDDSLIDADLYDVLWPADNPMFPPLAWLPTTDGNYEATARALDPNGRPIFEASITPNTACSPHRWWWDLYRTDSDDLTSVDYGRSHTLAHARRTVEDTARRWRDDPEAMERLDRLRRIGPHSTVACDWCGTTWQVETVLMANRCPTDGCDSSTFETYTLDELADAIEGTAP